VPDTKHRALKGDGKQPGINGGSIVAVYFVQKTPEETTAKATERCNCTTETKKKSDIIDDEEDKKEVSVSAAAAPTPVTDGALAAEVPTSPAST